MHARCGCCGVTASTCELASNEGICPHRERALQHVGQALPQLAKAADDHAVRVMSVRAVAAAAGAVRIGHQRQLAHCACGQRQIRHYQP